VRHPSILSRRDFLRLSALAGAGMMLSSCGSPLEDFSDQETETLRRLVLLYTNDEHGWLEPSGEAGGAAGMYRRWLADENYDPAGPNIALSGGDLFTGPALSTYFKGESTLDVMGAMGYAAAAIGNHDFDAGVDVLRQRAAQAGFPLLSANLRQKANYQTPDFARKYVIKEVNGIRIGLIGLTTRETPVDTQPHYVADYNFIPYEDALREVVPLVREEGAGLLIVVGHICASEMRLLAPVAAELSIPIVCGGHCHEELVETIEGVTIVQSGSFWRNYIRIALLFDTDTGQMLNIQASLQPNLAGREDARIAGRISGWRVRMDPAMLQQIGYAGQMIGWNSGEMARLLTQPWLAAYPTAQAAIFAPRYVQSLPPGVITPASILSMIPTDNRLIEMKLTGAQLVHTIEERQSLYGGIESAAEGYVLAEGSPLEPEERYRILIPEALYYGGNYYAVQQYDQEGQDTGLDWRTPVIEWVRSLGTNRQDPLERHLGL